MSYQGNLWISAAVLDFGEGSVGSINILVTELDDWIRALKNSGGPEDLTIGPEVAQMETDLEALKETAVSMDGLRSAFNTLTLGVLPIFMFLVGVLSLVCWQQKMQKLKIPLVIVGLFGFFCAIVAWVMAGVHSPLFVVTDDVCIVVDGIVNGGESSEGIDWMLPCLGESAFNDTDLIHRDFAAQQAENLAMMVVGFRKEEDGAPWEEGQAFSSDLKEKLEVAIQAITFGYSSSDETEGEARLYTEDIETSSEEQVMYLDESLKEGDLESLKELLAEAKTESQEGCDAASPTKEIACEYYCAVWEDANRCAHHTSTDYTGRGKSYGISWDVFKGHMSESSYKPVMEQIQSQVEAIQAARALKDCGFRTALFDAVLTGVCGMDGEDLDTSEDAMKDAVTSGNGVSGGSAVRGFGLTSAAAVLIAIGSWAVIILKLVLEVDMYNAQRWDGSEVTSEQKDEESGSSPFSCCKKAEE